MCTLGLILGRSDRYPTIVAANRDESLTRPARAPHLWPGREPRLVAGRDERAGGSWLGVNEHGLVAGLTNLWRGVPPDPSLESRGDIVLGLLAHESLEGASGWLERRDPRATNPFLCVVAGPDGRALFAHSEDDLTPHLVGAGIYAFGNRPPVDRPAKLDRAQLRLREAWEQRKAGTSSAIRTALQAPLAHHTGARTPEESVCVHGERFGTVSSTILLLGANGVRSRLFHAEGAPCQASFTDLSSELDRLASASAA